MPKRNRADVTAYPDQRRAWPSDVAVAHAAASDGWPLRVFERVGDGRRGSILWLGGRGDIVEKYLEAFAGWHDDGWHVTSFDWRGQGGSGRTLPDRRVGHIGDFATWIADLAKFWTSWTARTPGPHVVMGHSMGGHLVLRALIEDRIAPDAVILSAPMLGFESGPLPQWVAARVVALLGRIIGTRLAWSENERPADKRASRAAFLTHDVDRYADEQYWLAHEPSLALGPPSWGWVAAAYRSNAIIAARGAVERVRVPVLTVATLGDRLVSPAAIDRTIGRLPNGELMMFDASVAHEVLREADAVRDAILERISGFLGRYAPPR